MLIGVDRASVYIALLLSIYTYGHMTTEQARFEMDRDVFEAWMQNEQREREW